jgi:hypothetical protein
MDVVQQAQKLMPAITQHIWSQVLRRAPNVSEQAKKEVTEKMAKAMADIMPIFLELVIPVYQKHLTVEEVEAAIAFFNTREGKSFAGKTAAITSEAMQVGAEFGRRLGQEAAKTAVENLRKKGYQL